MEISVEAELEARLAEAKADEIFFLARFFVASNGGRRGAGRGVRVGRCKEGGRPATGGGEKTTGGNCESDGRKVCLRRAAGDGAWEGGWVTKREGRA